MNDDADMEILTLFQHNPDKAITQLMAAYNGLVFSVLKRKGLREEDIKDVTQDIWVNVSRKWHTFDPEKGKLVSWLSNVSSNKAIDYIRRNSRYQEVMDEAGELQVHAEVMQETAPDSHMDDLDAGRLLSQAMDLLPENQRLALDLHFFKGMSQREIAEYTDTPLGTVKVRLSQGLAKLRTMILPA